NAGTSQVTKNQFSDPSLIAGHTQEVCKRLNHKKWLESLTTQSNKTIWQRTKELWVV
ncbi:hypothetical protein LDENG_00125420, partial [Lucifuga dentata]